MAHPPKITDEKRQEFIELLANTGNVSKCCQALNVSRNEMYRHRRENPEFAEQWEEARETAVELLEDEAWRRAFEGIEKEIISHKTGFVIGIEKKYSDTLLMCLLQAHKPDKYQYRQRNDVNVSGNIKFRWDDGKTENDNNTV